MYLCISLCITRETACRNIISLCTTIEFGNFILVVSSVESEGPEPVAGLNSLPVYSELETIVTHLTDILHHAVLVVASCTDSSGTQQILGIANVTIETERQTVVEVAEV